MGAYAARYRDHGRPGGRRSRALRSREDISFGHGCRHGLGTGTFLSRMSTIQKFFLAVFPAKWAQGMEAESRAWIVKCLSCDHERSIWELGGIRWKAVGTPKIYKECPKCRQTGWHCVSYRKAE